LKLTADQVADQLLFRMGLAPHFCTYNPPRRWRKLLVAGIQQALDSGYNFTFRRVRDMIDDEYEVQQKKFNSVPGYKNKIDKALWEIFDSPTHTSRTPAYMERQKLKMWKYDKKKKVWSFNL